jgi:hypothetical protein
MTATIHKLSPLTIGRLACTSCGAETNAACNCGAPYVPAAQRVKEYDAANPGKSTRAAAADLGISKSAVSKARDQVSTDGHVTGRDGKQYPAKKPKLRPDLDELASRAKRLGWWLEGIGSRRLELCKDVGKDRAFVEMPVRLRDVAPTLDKIERDPDAFRHLYPRAPEPEEAPAPKKPAQIDKVAIAAARSTCIADVRDVINNAIEVMRRNGANNADISLLIVALRDIASDLAAAP